MVTLHCNTKKGIIHFVHASFVLWTDLSYQAAQKVLNAEPDDQIKVLQDLSQNFPSRTR